MNRGRIHTKISGSKGNIQTKSHVVFLGTGLQLHEALRIIFSVWFGVKELSFKIVEKHEMRSLYCNKYSDKDMWRI